MKIIRLNWKLKWKLSD